MKFSTSIRIILPAHRGLHVPLLLLWDHLHLLQQYEPRAQRGTSPPIRSMATVHTPHLPSFGKRFTSHFTAASSADVWPAKLQYQQWSFGSNCSGRKKGSQSLLSGEAVFSGQKMFVHIFSMLGTPSPLPEGSATIKWGLPLGRYPEAWGGGTWTWAVRARTAVCPPRMWLCPVVLWDGHRRPYFNEAAIQPWSASASLNHGLWSIRDAKRNVLPGLNALRQKKSLNCSLSMSAIQVVQMTSKCFSWKEIWAGNT